MEEILQAMFATAKNRGGFRPGEKALRRGQKIWAVSVASRERSEVFVFETDVSAASFAASGYRDSWAARLSSAALTWRQHEFIYTNNAADPYQ